ncbi:cell adhesion molecule DSCAM-like isoform X4 [Lineus longissimus]|uniref:cell adhesion molecule DSCAM-like isoform X4 n=1 Tax=Lineus longissimus TaxID=88925 RepID=UPI00315CBB75
MAFVGLVKWVGLFVILELQICKATNGQSNPNDDNPQGPIFISEPPSQIAFANTKGALIPCTAYGRPAPVLDWIRADGGPVDDIAGILRILPNNSLHFLPFEDTELRSNIHTASYRCVARNTVGQIVSRKVTVKGVLIRQYIAYSVRVNDVYITMGNTAVFKCNIDPYFVRDYITVTAWTRGAARVETGDRFSIMKTGELHMRNVRNEDSYLNYRCVTKNILTGAEKGSDPAALFVIDPVNSSPVIDDALTHLQVKESETIELPCAATGYPLPSYSWTKDDVPIILDHKRVRQLGGNLVIQNAGVGDTARYVCTASNTLGKRTAITQLIVTAPLSVHVGQNQQIVDVGNTATFNCTIFGHPRKSINWLRNSKPLKLVKGRVVLTTPTTLVISDVQRHDRGMYQCLVSNDKDNAQGTAQLSLGDGSHWNAAQPVVHTDVSFKDEYVQPGSTVSLRCVTSGNPLPAVSWELDDGEVPTFPRFKVGQFLTPDGDVFSYVNITNVRIEDGGQYRCQSRNKEGTAEHIGKLFVYGIPYIRPMNNVTAVANEELVIQCHVSGFPVASITWSRAGSNLPINHRQHVSDEGTLTIQNIQRNYDEGFYTCTVKNNGGQGSSRKVFISVMEPPSIDPFRFPKRKQGERVRVSCYVSRGDAPMTITWVKDGEEIPPDLGVLIQNQDPYTSTLSIGDSNPHHDGNYTCIASNQAASVNFTSEFHVDVPPRWVVEPEDSFVVLKTDVIIDCQTTGTPEPTVQWKKAKALFGETSPATYPKGGKLNREDPSNYQLIGQEAGGRVQQLANGSLLITDALATDHGYYLCHSSNQIGAGLSKVVFLTVHIPARFDDPEKNYTVLMGRNITMDCEAVGDSPISVAWSFNGDSLHWQYNDRLTVTHLITSRGKSKTSYLKVAPSLREDTGFYVCTTQNKFGHDSIMIRLTVLEKPEAPSGIDVEKVDSRSALLMWKAPFDGNSEITNYVIQYKNSSGTWDPPQGNVSVSGKLSRSTLDGLHPSFTYHVRVIANNSVGLGTPSNVIVLTTTEEAPNGPPTAVHVESTGSQSLKVLWEPPEKDKQNGLIKGYYVGYKQFNSTQPFMYLTKMVDVNFKGEQDINNLEKFTKYEVHVQAFNRKGAGPRSETVGVLTLEDVPSQPPQGVYATALSSQSIMVLWSPPPLYTLHGVLQGYKILYKIVREDEDESDAQFVTSKELKVVIQGLEKYTNYSVQVLAYTRTGEGVRSRPIHVRTQQDVPHRPADIKALPVGADQILVSWKPPLHPNGMITKYIVYIKHHEKERLVEEKYDASPPALSHMALGLLKNYQYSFSVSAMTVRGEGERTREVTQTPVKEVAARVASFSSISMSPWKHDVLLPCQAVGEPRPTIEWKKRGQPLRTNERIRIHPNGSLEISNVQSSDAANYTCRASNVYGADEITISLVVQVNRDRTTPPKAPTPTVAAVTSSSIQINWRSGSNGGSATQGFIFFYKKAFQDWKYVKLKPQVRSYTVNELYCGTLYKFQVQAFNRAGLGEMSRIVAAKTNGSTPIMPAQSLLIKQLNSTFLVLDLKKWQDGGCPITSYSIRYCVWGDTTWRTVSNHIDPAVPEKQKQKIKVDEEFMVQDLHPATWYIMKVTAYNDAGLTEAELKFGTLTYTGSTIRPIFIVHKQEIQFYEKVHIMVPLCGAFVIIIVFIVGVALYCKRRRDRLKYKGRFSVTSNLRRDLTAETSLMNDLDKRLNFESDTSRETPYTPEPHREHRNVNLLTESDDTGEDHRVWTYQNNSNTNSENSFNSVSGSVDSDGNINPYATFQYPREESLDSFQPQVYTAPPDDDDDIELEKERAQREAGLKGAGAEPVPDPKQSPPTKDKPLHRYQNVPGCDTDREPLVLSPRKYASADQIHVLFPTGPPKPPPIPAGFHTSKPKSLHSSSDEKGSQRHSAISSITTVSSNQEELMTAYENARRNQLASAEFMAQKESPQPTDSSESTEPGIRLFTQSPPKPDEKRQAACEVPLYEKRRPTSHVDMSSDTTAEEQGPESNKDTIYAHRRPRAKHKGKHRGQVVGKKIIRSGRNGPSSRCHSRASTGSTNSEEVTYSFDEPHYACPGSPAEGAYLSYRGHEDYPYGEYNPYHLRRKRRHGTPMPRYDIVPDTPGTDETRSLVSALARPVLTSPREEDESASLLERHYRTIKEEGKRRGSEDGIEVKKETPKYTDNFTVV